MTLWRVTLVAAVLTLSACERSASQARGGTQADDPFRALELIRANAPKPVRRVDPLFGARAREIVSRIESLADADGTDVASDGIGGATWGR